MSEYSWRRTVGFVLDLVQQRFLQMGACPPNPRLRDNYQQRSLKGTINQTHVNPRE